MSGRQNTDVDQQIGNASLMQDARSSTTRPWSVVVSSLMQSFSRTRMWTHVSQKEGIDNKDGDVPEYTNEHLERALLELKNKDKPPQLNQLKGRRKGNIESKDIYEAMHQDVCTRTSTVVSLEHEMVTDITYPVVIDISDIGIQQNCELKDQEVEITPDVNNTGTQSSADRVRLCIQTETDVFPRELIEPQMLGGSQSLPSTSFIETSPEQSPKQELTNKKSKIKSKVPVLKTTQAESSSSSSLYAIKAQCKIMKANKKYNMSRIPQRTKTNNASSSSSSKTNILKASTSKTPHCTKSEQQLIEKNNGIQQNNETKHAKCVNRSKEKTNDHLWPEGRKHDDEQSKPKLPIVSIKQLKKEVQPPPVEASANVPQEEKEMPQLQEADGSDQQHQPQDVKQDDQDQPITTLVECHYRQSVETLKKLTYTESVCTPVTIVEDIKLEHLVSGHPGNDASTMSDGLQTNAQCQSDDDDDDSDKRLLYEEQVYKHMLVEPLEPNTNTNTKCDTIAEQEGEASGSQDVQETHVNATEEVEIYDDDEYEDYDEFEVDEMEQHLRQTLKNSIKQNLQRKLKNQTKMFQRQSETTMQAVEKYMNPMEFAMLKLQGQKSLLSVGIPSAINTSALDSGMVHKRSKQFDKLPTTSGLQQTQLKEEAQEDEDEYEDVDDDDEEEHSQKKDVNEIPKVQQSSVNITKGKLKEKKHEKNKENEHKAKENIYNNICNPKHKIHEILRKSMPYNNIILPVFVPTPSLRESIQRDLKFSSTLKSNKVPESVKEVQNEKRQQPKTVQQQQQQNIDAVNGRNSIFGNVQLRPQQAFISGHSMVPFFYGQCDFLCRDNK